MGTKRCGFCGGSMLTVREGAKFCTTKCRVYASRSAAKLPQIMRDSPRFVRFLSTKRPVTVAGKAASSTNADTWTTHKEAIAATVGEGIGFVLGDGFACIDLDHCLIDGELAPWAAAVVAANPGTYIEVSRSGEGLHIFGLLPEGPGRKIRDGRNIEVYSTGRYIALTNNRFGGSPADLKPLVVPSM